jgi:hypothetical protein
LHVFNENKHLYRAEKARLDLVKIFPTQIQLLDYFFALQKIAITRDQFVNRFVHALTSFYVLIKKK